MIKEVGVGATAGWAGPVCGCGLQSQAALLAMSVLGGQTVHPAVLCKPASSSPTTPAAFPQCMASARVTWQWLACSQHS